MTAKSRWRGHPIVRVNGKWVYEDNGTPTAEQPNRRCGHCSLPNRPDGHDPCLGSLPGVMNACCGHGERNEAFIQFENGVTVRGFLIDGVTP